MTTNYGAANARWIRKQILLNSKINYDDLIKICDKEGMSHPANKQMFYVAKSLIKSRYGNEIPYNNDGSLNISGMIRLFLDKKGIDSSEDKARNYFASDGIELKQGIFSNARITYKKSLLKSAGNTFSEKVEEVVIPKEVTVPRAKFTGKQSAYSKEVVAQLFIVNEFVKANGGIDKVRSLLTSLEEVQSVTCVWVSPTVMCS